MSKPLTADDYFDISLCINHCIEEMNKLRFVSSKEWARLTNLNNKVLEAYNVERDKNK